MSAATWHVLIDAHGRRGAENMAIDEALLHAAGGGTAFLRLYRWRPPCLSFGRHEPATAQFDVHAIQRLGLDTVRRPTGGRAVWHDTEITYAVAGPVSLFGSLRETYAAIHQLLAAGLRRLGVPAQLASRAQHRPPSSGACFVLPVDGEIVVGERKLVGSAQCRHRDAFLQHGSILLHDRQAVVTRVARGAVEEPVAISLAEVLGRPVRFAEVAEAIAAQAQRDWPGTWHMGEAELPAYDTRRYEDPHWTWRA